MNLCKNALVKPFVLSLLVFVAPFAWSQPVNLEDPSNDDSTTVYPADYFAEFSPVSANDMLSRIPGIGLAMRSGGGGGRGLGSGEGQVLINGKRLTGKSNAGESQLSRISADQVDYIEIIRGSSEALGIRGASQVVNVVLLDTPSRSSTSAQLNFDRYSDGALRPGGNLAFSGQSGEFNYLLNIEAESRYNIWTSEEFSFDPDLNLLESRSEENARDQTDYQASVNLGYAFEQSTFQLNGLYGFSQPPSQVDRIIRDFVTDTVSQQREDNSSERDNWEIGGDYEFVATNGGRFRFLFIVNDRQFDYTRERFDVFDDSETKNLFLLTSGRDRERIARSTYSWNLTGSQGLEIGMEIAQTIRDSGLLMGLEDDEGVPSDSVGGLVPVEISNSDSIVEELRYETFAVHDWQINSRLSLKSSVIVETSTITQTGDVLNERDFRFVRPEIELRYNVTPSLQLTAGVRKDVSQLSFSDFSATVDNSDEDQNTQAGNPNIAQEQSWRYEINLEQRLPNDIGVFNAQFYYRDLTDVIDRIDVSPSADDLQSARGNIGDGKRYGVNFDVSSKLGFLSLPNALLTTSLSLRDSQVIDPFLGTTRRVRNNGRWSSRIGYRHDLPQWNMSYGFDHFNSSNDGSGKIEIDIIDIEERTTDAYLSAWVEKKAFGNFTFRFEAQNILKAENCRTRTRFIGATVDGILEEIEEYCSGNGEKLSFSIRTTF